MLSKQKLLGICFGAALTIASFGTVLAGPRTDIDKSDTDLKQHESRLEEKAKAKGMTVEELKKKIEERKAKLEREAKEKGISVEELKKQKKADRKAKLEEEAKLKGITVEELIKQKKSNGKLHR